MTDQNILKANEPGRQIGGDHYLQEYMHWDFAEQTGMGYLEGCATKYVSRWRKKDGVQGLMKSVHYIEKLKELNANGNRHNRSFILPEYVDACIHKFVTQSKSTLVEARIYAIAVKWQTSEDLDLMIKYIMQLIAEAHETAS